jgi:hypothetical protein
MPRRLRIQYEGAVYHLMSRGDRREEIFRDDLDREDFLKTLGAACQKLGGRSTPNRRRRSSSQQGSKSSAGKKRTYRSTQERPGEGGSCRGDALPNYDELEMDRPTFGNGIVDARFQSSSPIIHRFVSKVRTDPIFHSSSAAVLTSRAARSRLLMRLPAIHCAGECWGLRRKP